MTLHISTVMSQDKKEVFPIECLDQIALQENIIENCVKYREAWDKNYKLKLYLLHTSGPYFWIDIDDSEGHKEGNDNLIFDDVLEKIPYVAWFKSPSGRGLKILIKVNRDVSHAERKSIQRHIRKTVANRTGLIIDAVSDVAFVSDQPVTFSDGVFEIPDEDDNGLFYDDLIANASVEFCPTSMDYHKLKEIIDLCPKEGEYNRWLAIVMAVLNVYGEEAIPLLEEKWGTDASYKALLQCCDGYNANILETIWNSRIRKNASSESGQYIRRVVTGATGSGKSQYAVDEMKSLYSEYDYMFHNYDIYVVSSVEQAIDFAKKLDRVKITYEILVSQQTYDLQEDGRKWWLTTSSSNNKAVKIIQLSALKHNAHHKYIQSDRRRLCTMYIDELTLTDFVRPSIIATNRVKAYTGIKTATDMVACYESKFSYPDMNYAIKLAMDNDNSDFVSSILYQSVNTTVLTTEELTTICLEELGFKKTTIKKVETEALSETCTLHVSDSPYYVQQYVQSEAPKHIYDMEFDNIFANKCGFANGNLQTIKGQHITGKNLSIIRCLPSEATIETEALFTGCFKKIEGVNPVAMYYKDSLMQAVGRSIGFRGETEAWVMVHSSVWAMIKDSKWIYQIKTWDVEIDPERKKIIDDQRSQKKSLMDSYYVQKAKFIQDDRIARTKNALIVTGNPNDTLTKKDIKLILGSGFKLKSVAQWLNLSECRKNSIRYLEGVRKV